MGLRDLENTGVKSQIDGRDGLLKMHAHQPVPDLGFVLLMSRKKQSGSCCLLEVVASSFGNDNRKSIPFLATVAALVGGMMESS